MFSSASSQKLRGCGNQYCGQQTYPFIALEEHYSSALVSCCKIVSCLVELDSGYDVRYEEQSQHDPDPDKSQGCGFTFCDIFHIALVTKASVKVLR